VTNRVHQIVNKSKQVELKSTATQRIATAAVHACIGTSSGRFLRRRQRRRDESIKAETNSSA